MVGTGIKKYDLARSIAKSTDRASPAFVSAVMTATELISNRLAELIAREPAEEVWFFKISPSDFKGSPSEHFVTQSNFKHIYHVAATREFQNSPYEFAISTEEDLCGNESGDNCSVVSGATTCTAATGVTDATAVTATTNTTEGESRCIWMCIGVINEC